MGSGGGLVGVWKASGGWVSGGHLVCVWWDSCRVLEQCWTIRQKIIELHVKQYKKNNCIVQFNMQLIVNCNCMRFDIAISDAIWYILERFLINPTFCVIPLPQSAGNP